MNRCRRRLGFDADPGAAAGPATFLSMIARRTTAAGPMTTSFMMTESSTTAPALDQDARGEDRPARRCRRR